MILLNYRDSYVATQNKSKICELDSRNVGLGFINAPKSILTIL